MCAEEERRLNALPGRPICTAPRGCDGCGCWDKDCCCDGCDGGGNELSGALAVFWEVVGSVAPNEVFGVGVGVGIWAAHVVGGKGLETAAVDAKPDGKREG